MEVTARYLPDQNLAGIWVGLDSRLVRCFHQSSGNFLVFWLWNLPNIFDDFTHAQGVGRAAQQNAFEEGDDNRVSRDV